MEPVELSMVAIDKDRKAARRFDLVNASVLTTAGLYGPNASGKSNVLDAIRWLTSAVRLSLRSWDTDIPRESFRFGEGPVVPSCFTVELVVQGIRYEYFLEVSDHEVLTEALYSYPKKQRRTLFEREGMDLGFRRGLGTLSGTRELLTPTTLALSAAMRFDSQTEIEAFGRELSAITTVNPRRRPLRRRIGANVIAPVSVTDRIFIEPGWIGDDRESEEIRNMALGLLRFADLGIDDVEIVRPKDAESGRRPYLRLVHRSYNEHAAFDLFDESDGTQTWFHLIGPVLRALARGRTLLLDEIDASLHPALSAKLLELFRDPTTNPSGAQLIFTSHDTSLLNHLNRDEVWLTEKGSSGATALTALAEFGGDKVRRSMNLERAYLQGRFGAVPELNVSRLLLALEGQDQLINRGTADFEDPSIEAAFDTELVINSGEE